jgi:hypothetical protein
MSEHEQGVEYWKFRFQRERAQALAEAKENLHEEIAVLKKENEKLRAREPEVVEVRQERTGFWPFAIGLGLGFIIGG